MSSAQASSSLAADAPRYGNDPLVGAYYARNTGTGAPVVSQLLAGAGVTLSPVGGQGVVTVTSTAVGVSALNPGNNTGATTLASSDGTVNITGATLGTINFSVPGVSTTNYSLAATPLSGQTQVVIQAVSGLTSGTTYNYSIFLRIKGSATVAPAVTTALAYLNLVWQNAKFPGAASGTTSNLQSIPLAPLSAVIYDGANENFQFYTTSGTFTATGTTVNLAIVPTAPVTATPPYFAANSLFVATGSQVNITPQLLTNPPS